ncbi:glycosyltransferase family 4 protein [Heyndrickxia coagulans]|uniref:Glycosyltransferase family 1 protein n=1 Tax=Heyndrickxia coagulans TaxID=1398 RepID=A0AAW7CG08_HEYCO|nr:glycosyltransferase family 1 protein [Heyndrickxia coagulans]MDL5039743.1 glycosyltransferase family 1 protein [Heyndrickxia coagulans]
MDLKVYINGRFLTQNITGVQRFANEIVKEIDNYLDNNFLEVELLVPRIYNETISYKNIIVKRVGKLNGHFWEQFELPFYASKGLLINLCNTGPMFNKNQITVIHDVAVYSNSENFSFLFKTWYRILLNLQGKFSKRIVTVSNFSKKEIVKNLNIKAKKVQVIYEGKEHFEKLKSNYSIIKKYKLENKPYLLAVSSLNPNKNFGLIIKSLEYLKDVELDIVIAGGTDPKVFNSKNIKIPSKVKYVGYVSDTELKALYEHAFCFIYPSYYEGFGLPPLEAMSIGCPIIISNRASLPEVGGEAALYCNPDDPKDLAMQIRKIFFDKECRMKMIKNGYYQSRKFTWKKSTKELLQIIAKLEREDFV